MKEKLDRTRAREMREEGRGGRGRGTEREREINGGTFAAGYCTPRKRLGPQNMRVHLAFTFGCLLPFGLHTAREPTRQSMDRMQAGRRAHARLTQPWFLPLLWLCLIRSVLSGAQTKLQQNINTCPFESSLDCSCHGGVCLTNRGDGTGANECDALRK